jgi:uncharacterized lipoprotein
MDLTPDDWRRALEACAAIGKRGKARPWARLAEILGKMGLKVDGENLKKGLREAAQHARPSARDDALGESEPVIPISRRATRLKRIPVRSTLRRVGHRGRSEGP